MTAPPTPNPLARYYFAPAMREGLAAYITPETAASTERERAIVDARLFPSVNDKEVPEKKVVMHVGLFGPGDVLGFDPLVVTRTDPRPNVWDYEPNYMPLVEFSEPDLPWRFTPEVAVANASGKLKPWITLIVLKDDEIDGIDERLADDEGTAGLPIKWVNVKHKSSLPNLDYAWLWAHVHVTDAADLGATQEALQTTIRDRLTADPKTHESHIVARLVCPRRLEPQTHYTAFVVPTYRTGLIAAGLEAPLAAGDSALLPAWDTTTNSDDPVSLAYYYRFEFGTSVKGDFEYLVRLLEPRPLPGLGKRRMECGDLPYDLPDCAGRMVEIEPGTFVEDPHVLDVEGALMSPELMPGQWNNETTEISSFRGKLAELLNMAVGRAEAGGQDTDAADPRVVPPIFGRRHAQQFRVASTNPQRWFGDVNLDPRQRAAAGCGALVVEQDQEAMMASIWDQLGDIEDANQAMAHGQVGVAASTCVFKRLDNLDVNDFLTITAPVFGRIPSSTAGNVANELARSPIPPAAFDAAFRRVLRRGGGIRKRQQRGQLPPPEGRDILSRLNTGELTAAGPLANPGGMPSICEVTDAALATLEQESEPDRRARKKFRILGRVIDKYSRRGIPGVRVEAWDRDPFLTDLIGSTLTNNRGAFRLEFDESFYREWLLDPLPDVFFKVLRDQKSLTVTAPQVMRDLRAGDTTVVVEVDQASAAADLPFIIKGKLLDRMSHTPVPWLRIEAWDRDLVMDDLVGGAVSDAEGQFTIRFNAKYFKEWFFDRKPDLYFKVFRGQQLIANTRPDARRNVPPGEISIAVEIQAPTPASVPPDSRANDFCEHAITCDTVKAVIASNSSLSLHALAGDAICDGIRGWLDREPPVSTNKPVDLVALQKTVKDSLLPSVTIPTRIMKRLRLNPGVHQKTPLARLESEIQFPQPMYEPLAALSQDLVLPGVNTVPQNTISILKTNRRFMEAYMLSINDAVMSECVWRGAPVYVWTTCARQFWDVRGLVDDEDAEITKDITRIARWTVQSELGTHDPRATDGGDEPVDRAVVLVRGDVLKRYPNTLVYAIATGENDKPMLAEYQPSDTPLPERKWPIFSGSLAPDLTFLGFDITPRDMCKGNENHKGYFIVLEERLSEPRFGFDLQNEGEELPELDGTTWWYDMTWSHLTPTVNLGDYIDGRSFPTASTHLPSWGGSSAIMANIALQRPVRMAVHASKMLPQSLCE